MLNVALTSLYKGMHPEVGSLMNLSMWWPREGRPYPVEYMKIRLDAVGYYLRQQRKFCRTMWLNNILMWETDYANGVDPVKQVREGMDVTRTRNALRALSNYLKSVKLPVDLVFCDCESTLSVFAVGWQTAHQILTDPLCRAKLPPYLLKLNPAIFLETGHPQWANYVRIWSKFSMEFLLGTLKSLLVDSKFFNIPDPKGVIRKSCIVNFASQLQRFPVADLNGWPHVNASIDGMTSNPSLYLYTTDGSRISSYVHHPLWNRLIWTINLVRSSTGKPNWRTFPIVDAPTWRHPWVWEQLMAHCIRAGITVNNGQWFLYWNPHQSPTEDAKAIEILTRHDQGWPRAGPLPRIPWDVDSIETNGFVTRYSDFLDVVQPPDVGTGEGVENEGVTHP